MLSKKIKKSFLSIFFIIFVFNLKLYSTVEYLDSTFGMDANGIVQTTIGISSKINDIASYNCNKFVTAGYTTINGVQNLAVARYNCDGTLDNSFGSNGVVTKLVGTNCAANAVTVDVNNNIVVTGYAVINGVNNFLIVRYLPNGSLDLSFGVGGVVTKLIGSSPAVSNSIAIDANGKIIIGGTAVVGNKNNLFVARYNSNGILDTTFGAGGAKTLSAQNGYTCNSIKIDSSAKIVIGGSMQIPTGSNLLVARLTITGARDLTFGNNNSGVVTTPVSGSTTSFVKSIFIDPSNRIVAGGYSGSATNGNFVIARYQANGAIDTTFGTNLNGIQKTTIGSNSQVNYVINDLNNKIIAGGVSDNQITLARYFINGSLDTSFGINGILTNAIGTSSQINSLLLQSSDGRVIAGGNANDSGQSRFTLIRYNKNNTDFVNITSIENGNINTKIPVVVGTSSLANAQVQVLVNGTLLTTVTTNNFGSWNAGMTNVLPLGPNTIQANLMNGSNVLVSHMTRVNVLDNLYEDSVFSYSTQSQSSTSSSYTSVPFNNNIRLGTWSYLNSIFTCSKAGTYLIEYVATAGSNGSIPVGTSSINVATTIAINNVEYLGSEGNANLDLIGNFSKTLTRGFIKQLNYGDTVALKFAVNIIGTNTGFSAGLMTSPNAIGNQPCYSLTITRIG